MHRFSAVPSEHGGNSNRTCRMVSTSVTQKCHLNGPVVFTPFSAAFTLKHRELQTIQRPAARRSSASRERPHRVLVPPTLRAPSKKADLGTWELSHTRALRVVCLERLRASKEIFRCTYMLSGIGFRAGPLADSWVIRPCFESHGPLPEQRPATP